MYLYWSLLSSIAHYFIVLAVDRQSLFFLYIFFIWCWCFTFIRVLEIPDSEDDKVQKPAKSKRFIIDEAEEEEIENEEEEDQ